MSEKQTILVVDDRSVDRRLLRKMLESSGYGVLEAADGEEGLEMARRNKPDLIITDTLMPRIDGFQLLRNIKKDEKTKDIPFILYSAVYTGYEDEKLAHSLGANAFIRKPIETEEFLLKVEAAIESVKARKETATEELIEEEEEYLRRYSQVVAANLEEKVRELEATNEVLQMQIVEELEVEDALRASEEKYRVLFETAKDAIFLSDETGKFVDVNQAACKTLGYSKEELLKLSNKEIDADPTGYEAFLQVRNGLAKEAIFEVNQQRKDGTLLPVEITGKFFESDGRRISLAIARDITEHKAAEEALRQMSNEQEVILDSMPAMIFYKDKENRFLRVNKVLADIFGLPKEEIIGKTALELSPAEKDYWKDDQEVMKSGQPKYNIMEPAETPGGTLWFQTDKIPYKDSEGNTIGIIGFSIDITERKRAEDALRIERDNLISILESMDSGVYIVNQQYDIQYVNPVLKKDFGSVEGRKCYEYFHDLDDVCPWCKNQDVFAGKIVRWEWHSPKNQRTYDLVDTPLKNPDGNISKLEIFHDITERKAAEEALRESEKQLRRTKEHLDNIIESSADAIVVVDMGGMVRSWNKAAEEYMGYTADEVIGSSNRKFFEDFEEPERIMEMVLRDGELKNYRTVALNKDNKPVLISMSAALLKDYEGMPIGTVRISRDITKEVELEERIEEERDNMNLIFDSMVDGVYIVSKDYEIEFMNKVLIDEFGDRVGSICYKAFHDREGHCPLCKNPEVMKGETVQWEWNSGKRNKTYDLIETPQKNVDGTISKLTLFRDITERKRAEEELEKKIEELRKFNEMTVDRELKMVELKKKINVLLQESGKEPRYKIPEEINTGTSR